MKGELEPDLPVTPTNEGRRPRISNFGYNVAYPDLWPLLIGLAGSVIIGLAVAFGALRFHWSVSIITIATPLAVAHLYVKMFVEDALPHTQQDTVAKWLSLEPDFHSPASQRMPLVPSLRPSLTMAADSQEDDGLHPLLNLRAKFAKAGRITRR